jgi:hypothetical protein
MKETKKSYKVSPSLNKRPDGFISTGILEKTIARRNGNLWSSPEREPPNEYITVAAVSLQ